MPSYEYKVVPAPKRAKPVKGLRKGEERFARTLTELMNELGAAGWEYMRADALPVEERSGLTSRVTVYQNVLVFRRPRDTAAGDTASDANTVIETPTPAEPPEPRLKSRLPLPRREPDGPRPSPFPKSDGAGKAAG